MPNKCQRIFSFSKKKKKKTSFFPVCKAVEDMYEQLEFTITQ